MIRFTSTSCKRKQKFQKQRDWKWRREIEIRMWTWWSKSVIVGWSWWTKPRNSKALLPESTAVTEEARKKEKMIHQHQFGFEEIGEIEGEKENYLDRRRFWGGARWASDQWGYHRRQEHGIWTFFLEWRN